MVRNEDFVYNPRISVTAPVGPINRNKLGRNGVMSPLYTVFRTHDIDTEYLEWFFKSDYWHSFMNFNGDSGARSDRFSIKDAVFFEMPIPLPSIDEQRRIGALLNQINNLITLHQRKYFYKLTSAGTTRTFQNTNAWEQRKFEDLYDYASEGGTPDTNNPAFYEGGKIPFVKIEDTVEKYIDSPKSYITEEGMNHSSAWLIPKGNVIFTNGATVGNVAINRLPVTTKQGILGIIPSKKVTSEFLFYLLSSTEFQREVRSRMATGTFATIILKSLNEIPVCFPSNTNEQESIITILSKLDNLITLHQRERILHEIQNN